VARRSGHAPELDALLERGIRYLDSVRNTAPSDPQLISEVASAYEELGLLEEKSPYAGPANKQKALSTYQQSAELMGNLVGALPEDPATRERFQALNQRIKDLGGTLVLIPAIATPDQVKAFNEPPRTGKAQANTGSLGPQSPTPQTQRTPSVEDPLRFPIILPPVAPPPTPVPVATTPAETPARVEPALPPAEAVIAPITPPPAPQPPPLRPVDGTLECGDFVGNSEKVFPNFPLNIKFEYDPKKWDVTLQPVDGQSQRLILKNKSSNQQKNCKVKWTRSP